MIFTREYADALLAAAPGPAYLAVPAEPVPCPADTDGDGDCATCFRQPGIHGDGPPAEWVALTEPCGGCGGAAMVYERYDGNQWDTLDCPDCGGSGRRRFPIAVDCPSPRSCPPMTRQLCPHSGIHTLGSAEVIEVLPVSEDLDVGTVTLWYGRPRILRRNPPGPRFTHIDPIGTPEPGGYIIHIDNIKDTA